MLKRTPLLLISVVCLCLQGCLQPRYTASRQIVTNYVLARDMPVPNLTLITQYAQAGEPTAQNHLGALYYRGIGVSKSHKTARYWWEQSAGAGFAEAQYNLGMLNFHGSGIKTDFVEGCKWLNMAAAQGHPDAIAAYRVHCER